MQDVWRMRAVQLDLARQMETPEFIFAFMDFIAANGYNTLVLYLEGRIRTASFPWPEPAESYSPEQIRGFVAGAAERGLEVMPVVSTLGHAEHFLRHSGLAHLAELRDGRAGRFGSGRSMFCPSLPETFTFLDSYLDEVAELFPGKYFHVGGDESWDIGYCPACRDRIELGGETQGGIFAAHLRRCHELVTGRLGKRMIIWDDMFELYPEALDELPRDIILCCWNYDGDMAELPQGHFLNRIREDVLAQYARLGFEHLVAPWDLSTDNLVGFTGYALPRRPLGGLLTTWEKGCSFLFESFPAIAMAGRWWAAGGGAEWPEAGFAESVRAVLGEVRAELVEAVITLSSFSSRVGVGHGAALIRNLSRGPLTVAERERRRLLATLAGTIREHADEVGEGLGREVIADLLYRLDRDDLLHELRLLVPLLVVPGGSDDAAERRRQQALSRIAGLRRRRLEQWQRHRPGLPSSKLEEDFNEMADALSRLGREDKAGRALLCVDFFLPDAHSAQRTALSVRWHGQTSWTPVADGVFKEPLLRDGFYRYEFPCVGEVPEAIRLESRGFGGQGLAFLWMVTAAGGRFVPAAVLAAAGQVEHPENLLRDDRQWCFLGERNTRRAILNPGLATARHVLELAVAPQDAC